MDRRQILGSAAAAASLGGAARTALTAPADAIPLPPPRLDGPISLERALARRRSVRAFDPAPLALAHVSQLLWAAQGVTGAGGRRTAPSAGALFPLTIHVAAAEVAGLAPAAYRYEPPGHAIFASIGGDIRAGLAAAARQDWLGRAPLIFLISAELSRAASRYGAVRGARFAQIEAGHAAQNILLQAVCLGLGATDVGAFDDAAVAALLRRPAGEIPMLLIPAGRPIG